MDDTLSYLRIRSPIVRRRLPVSGTIVTQLVTHSR